MVYSIEGNTIDRTSNKNGKGYGEDVSPTLNTQDRHGCCYAADCRNGALNEELSGTLQAKPNGGFSYNCINPMVYESNGYAKYRKGVGTLRASGADCGPGSENLCVYPNVTGPLMANSHPGSYTGQDAFGDMLPVIKTEPCIYPGVGITSKQNASNPMPGDPAPTLSTDSRNYLVKDGKPPCKYIIRRLTPLECCRLQGFPDWWEEGVEGSDSARYKMWGNGMALPNMLHVMRGIARVEGEIES